MRRSPVVGAAFGLLFFYWIALFLFDLLRGQIGLSSDWVARMSDRGLAILAGAIAGVVLVGYGMWLKRHLARMRLIGDDVRGVRCSIGELPVVLQAPEQLASPRLGRPILQDRLEGDGARLGQLAGPLRGQLGALLTDPRPVG